MCTNAEMYDLARTRLNRYRALAPSLSKIGSGLEEAAGPFIFMEDISHEIEGLEYRVIDFDNLEDLIIRANRLSAMYETYVNHIRPIVDELFDQPDHMYPIDLKHDPIR